MGKGKGGGFGAVGRPGGGRNMLRQIEEMQARMLAEQESLGRETVEVSVGGGAVAVVMNGHQKLQSVAIRPELLSPDEAEMLSDLIIAAVNEAVERSQAIAGERMGALTQGLGLPPGLGL
ncbi:YbaB/EbfC family nucleoid-associated protein [bacterium]|nr:MAG: YbaB/EbfC family nucleoid-associated protein [bacterium]